MTNIRLLQGHVLDMLATLPEASVQSCITSPPYWGLRDYKLPPQVWGDGWTGSLGLEPTPELYVTHLVEVFTAVWRVLRDDGTLWLNLGSSYFTANARAYADDRGPSLSLQRERDPSCGNDGIAPQDWTGADSACSDLCDECLADFLSHRDRSVGNGRRNGQSARPSLPTDRGIELMDSGSASPAASPFVAPVSTMIESWRQHRGACSRCDSRAVALSGLRSSSGDVQAFARMTWLEYSTRLKHKDMVPTPWMVAMALQSVGWWLRSDIVWAKPNPIPESVRDRPTKSHEYVFLLTKSACYYFDAQAISEPATYAGDDRGARTDNRRGTECNSVSGKTGDTRNARSVWTIPTQGFRGAHFAVMPEALAERCILAGCPPGGTVMDPFAGSGTVGKVAERLGRDAVLIDLKPEYSELQRDRVTEDAPLFVRVER